MKPMPEMVFDPHGKEKKSPHNRNTPFQDLPWNKEK
jgi:hypothetical protein